MCTVCVIALYLCVVYDFSLVTLFDELFFNNGQLTYFSNAMNAGGRFHGIDTRPSDFSRYVFRQRNELILIDENVNSSRQYEHLTNSVE